MINTISKLYVVSTEGMSMHNEDGMWGKYINIYIYKNFDTITAELQQIDMSSAYSCSAKSFSLSSGLWYLNMTTGIKLNFYMVSLEPLLVVIHTHTHTHTHTHIHRQNYNDNLLNHVVSLNPGLGAAINDLSKRWLFSLIKSFCLTKYINKFIGVNLLTFAFHV